ncbi:Inner membrane protein yjcH [Serratia fonticola]|uniref:Inner membrane protein yjcH n=1 Tax=Serratia fonticola TaxID=47917 RepID=A0A4U9T5G6_SERFO|nr:Inner membrane protein yjcH [Serratia fonticola]
MNEDIYQRIEENPRFQELVQKRSRFAWLLSLITLALYVGFILLIAFDPQWLGTPLWSRINHYPWDPGWRGIDRDFFRVNRDLCLSCQR